MSMSEIIISPILILIALLILLFIVFLVYFNIYKKRINKSIEHNESTAHISMISTESVGKIVVIIGAVYFAISTMNQLSDIASDIQQTKNELKSEIFDLNGKIYELQEQLGQQNSIFSSFEYSLGEINSENNTVETTLRCVPKVISEDTTVTVNLGNETVTLEAREGGVFTATKPLPLFADISGKVTVAVTTGGITNTQIISDLFYDALCNECLPLLGDGYMLMHEFADGKISINGEYDGLGKGEGITDVKLLFIIDDSVVKTLDIDENGTTVNETLKMNSNSLFELVAEGKDSYGYIHRKVLWGASENTEYMYMDMDKIMDKDGNVLFGE